MYAYKCDIFYKIAERWELRPGILLASDSCGLIPNSCILSLKNFCTVLRHCLHMFYLLGIIGMGLS